jgi:hypothetical protein
VLAAARLRSGARGAARDATTGEDCAVKAACDGAATSSAVIVDEIGNVDEWVGMIARQAGLTVPLAQTL